MMNDAGVGSLLAAGQGWVLLCSCMDVIATITTAGMDFTKSCLKVDAAAWANGALLTYANLAAGLVAKTNTTWKGWSANARRGYAYFETFLQVELAKTSRRLATDKNGGIDGRASFRDTFQEVLGSKKAAVAACIKLYEGIEALKTDAKYLAVADIGSKGSRWADFNALALLPRKYSQKYSLSRVNMTEDLMAEELVREIIAAASADATTSYEGGQFVTKEQVKDARNSVANKMVEHWG